MSIRRALLALALSLSPAWGAPPKPAQVRQVSKARLRQIITAGPQHLVASVKVAPHFHKGRFVGFRIQGFAADSPFVNNPDVRVGDVLISVNEETLERPDQFMHAWEVVGRADTIDLLVLRGGERHLYRWRVVP